MTAPAKPPIPCSEPGCHAPGKVRVVGNKAWFCFTHKPVGRKVV